MSATVSSGFGKRRLLVHGVHDRTLIPWITEEIETGNGTVKVRNFDECAEVDSEITVAIVPGTVLVQTGESCQPYIVTVIRPYRCFGKITIHAECGECENAKCHLPDMVVSNMVLQPVVEVRIELTSASFYFFQ